MNRIVKRVGALVLLLSLVYVGVMLLHPVIGVKRTYAQNATPVPGFSNAGTNAVVNAAIGNALATTNPASNFLVLVQGGPVYCSGSEQIVGQSTFTFVANSTQQIEWNCFTEQLYAKTAVVLPGGQVPSTSGGVPGQPGTFLAPNAGVELGVATVVCNATACGNGGNGSITDIRQVGLFPGAGTPLNTTTFANLPTTNVTDGTMIICTNCAVAVGGVSATCSSGAVVNLAIREGGAWVCR